MLLICIPMSSSSNFDFCFEWYKSATLLVQKFLEEAMITSSNDSFTKKFKNIQNGLKLL